MLEMSKMIRRISCFQRWRIQGRVGALPKFGDSTHFSDALLVGVVSIWTHPPPSGDHPPTQL